MLGFMFQQQRTHHRRQRQGDETGDDNGTGEGQRKLDEQLAGAPGHEGHRGINGRQGDGHCHHRKPDLFRAQEGRLHARHAFLDVAIDVLQHDDRVIDDQTDGQHQRQQGQRVDGEAEYEHQRKGTDQRHRDGYQRDQRGAHIAQEEEDDHQHQRHSLGDGREHRIDRAVDEHGGVISDIGCHALGQFGNHLGQLSAQTLGEFERVGRRLFDHPQRHRCLAIEANRTALGCSTDLNAPKIGDAHRVTVAARIGCLLDDDAAELFRRRQIGLRHYGKFTALAFDSARRHLDVLLLQGVLDIGGGQVVGCQALAVEPDAHGKFALAEDTHIGGTRQGLQPWFDDAIGDIGYLQRRVSIGGEGHPDDRVGISLDLGDHRLLDIGRQLVAHPRDAVAHVGCSGVRVTLELEAHGDL